jgi:hypothetical protein
MLAADVPRDDGSTIGHDQQEKELPERWSMHSMVVTKSRGAWPDSGQAPRASWRLAQDRTVLSLACGTA